MNFAYLSHSLFCFFGGVRVAHLYSFLCCSIMCHYVLCCDVRYDLHINTMFGFLLPPVVCRRAHALFTFLCLLAYSGVQHILCCVFVLFFFVLCTICCQFLWIVHFWLPFRYSHLKRLFTTLNVQQCHPTHVWTINKICRRGNYHLSPMVMDVIIELSVN